MIPQKVVVQVTQTTQPSINKRHPASKQGGTRESVSRSYPLMPHACCGTCRPTLTHIHISLTCTHNSLAHTHIMIIAVTIIMK